jgi:4-oxalocrotonate tautomerase
MPGDQEGVAMPLIQINLASGRTAAQKRALLQAVTDAVESSIGAPLESIRVWISEFEPTEYMAGGELLADRQAAQSAS